MKIDDEILVNKFGQGIINEDVLSNIFHNYNLESKRAFLNDMVNLIMQSKVTDNDIEPAIIESKLKPSFTPCVMLQKGVANHNLYKILQLPEAELEKVLRLFINLFKIGYQRRFEQEKGDLNKWWYWDLSDDRKIEIIKKNISNKAL